MKILALEKKGDGSSEEGISVPLLEAEARRVWDLYREGFIREIYFRGDRREAVLILEAVDLSTAKSGLDALPLVANGLIAFDLIPLAPYEGFSRLFA